jgi:MoxR-like ATPase
VPASTSTPTTQPTSTSEPESTSTPTTQPTSASEPESTTEPEPESTSTSESESESEPEPTSQCTPAPAPTTTPASAPQSVEDVSKALAAHDYLADEGLATAIFLAMTLHRPLFLEGEAGVGKTEVAKVISAWTGGELLRLQCYEGINLAQAAYEWDYARQLLHLRAVEASAGSAIDAEDEIYAERFLVRRPLLRALDSGGDGDRPPPVLLVDEIDRADDEFEALLLEILSEYAVTVPELGTVRAAVPPVVVLTSNRTRDVHDALKRRCLYHWVEHPGLEREVEIIRLRAPEAGKRLAREIAAAAAALRSLGLYKPPGVAETIDWAAAVAALGRTELDEHTVDVTLGAVLKYQEDQQRVRTAGLSDIVRAAVLRSG